MRKKASDDLCKQPRKSFGYSEMATVGGHLEYSSTGNILKRILNSNKNTDSLKQRGDLYGCNLMDTQSQQFLDQAHDNSIQTVYSAAQHSAGPSSGRPNVTAQRDGRTYTVRGGADIQSYTDGRPSVNNEVNGGQDHSSSTRAHSHLDQSENVDSSGNPSFQSEFLNISEGIDLDSLTPANLCRLSFVDLANLTIVSLVQLQKYGQVILNLQQDVSVLKDEIDSLKGTQPQNSNKQPINASTVGTPASTPVSSTGSAKDPLSNAAENFQKLDAMLEKLPSGKVRDCVECLCIENSSSKKSMYACRVCWRGLHRSPNCVYKHRCLKTLVRDLGLSNDAGDYENDESSSSLNDYSGYTNGDVTTLYNGVDDPIDYTTGSASMLTCESYPASPKTVPGKRKKSLQSILPVPNKMKKTTFGNGRVDPIFLHCIKKMEAGSRRECSSCSDRKAGKRQRSRYMCSKCGRGLHSRGSCVTVHSCWVEQFKGWESGKEFTREEEDIKIKVESDQDYDLSSEMAEDHQDMLDGSQEKDAIEDIDVYDTAVAAEVTNDSIPLILADETIPSREEEDTSSVSASTNNHSLVEQRGDDEGTEEAVTDQDIRREVQQEFQVEVANVLKVLDEG